MAFRLKPKVGYAYTDMAVGDWDGNGTTTVGMFDPATGTWHLRNTNGAGADDLTFVYGGGHAIPGSRGPAPAGPPAHPGIAPSPVTRCFLDEPPTATADNTLHYLRARTH